MPLPTLQKTWQFNVNQLLPVQADNETSARHLIWNMKNTLCSFPQNPWVVSRSCNGLAVANGDLWPNVGAVAVSYTLPGSGSSSRSWAVLKNPNIGSQANGYQILLDCILSNGVSWMGLFVSPSAGFTGGTTISRPTATDIRQGLSGFNWGVNTDPNWSYTNTGYGWTSNKVYRLNGMMSTDGKCTRLWLVSDWTGTTRVQSFLMVEELKNVKPGVDPVVKQWLANNGSDVLTTGTLFYASGVEGQNLDFNIGAQPQRGTTVVENAALLQSFANEISNEWPMWPLGAAILNTVNAGPSNTPVITPGYVGRVGDFYDLWLGSSGVASLDTYPADGSNQFAQFGPLIVPWDGSTPLDS